ncbi:MAG: hypothetical protein JJE04_10050 [Acidobacteriia bacterium]|nr:hypothetical protein [Terriglobia bacterium]
MLLWKSHGVFATYNIVFDTDPNARLSQLAHGLGAESLAHPITVFLFSWPLRAVSEVVDWIHGGSDPIQLRESIAVWITPLGSSIKVGIAYLTGRVMGASRVGGLGLALLAGFSLAPAVFGALPEHYPLSGLALTATFAWAAAVQFGAAPNRYLVWLALSLLVTGISITNIGPVLSLYLVCRLSNGQTLRRALASAAVLGLLSVGIMTCVSLACYRTVRGPDPAGATVSFVARYLRRPALEIGMRYGVALATSVIGPYPAVIPNQWAVARKAEGKKEINVQFSYDASPLTAWTWARTLAILSLAGLGAWQGWRRDTRFRGLSIGALMVLGHNGILHTVWGTEWMLYSMHWHPALLMLLAGWLVRSSQGGAWMLLTLGLVSAVDAAMVIREMLQLLERALV